MDSWAQNDEFCVENKDANSEIVFGVKDGNPRSASEVNTGEEGDEPNNK